MVISAYFKNLLAHLYDRVLRSMQHRENTEMPFYSEEDTIAAFRSYYRFLTKVFIDESWILEPPAGGWPNITEENMARLGKTPAAVSLLRHLPYISSEAYPNQPQGAPDTTFADWQAIIGNGIQRDRVQFVRACSEGSVDGYEGQLPSHFISLTYGDKYNRILLLDTMEGVIHWLRCPSEIYETASPESQYHFPSSKEEEMQMMEDFSICRESVEEHCHVAQDQQSNSDDFDQEPDNNIDGMDDEEDYDDEGAEWLDGAPYWSIKEFFEMLKNHILARNFYVDGGNEMHHIWMTGQDPEVPALIAPIYRKYGWPDIESFDKRACMSEVRITLREYRPEDYPQFH